jgi:hypothetical protein
MTDWRGGARPGVGAGASKIAELVTTNPSSFDVLFRGLVRHACNLGPRVVGEILLRLVPDRGVLIRELQRYARFDARFIRAVGAGDWLDRRDLVREVRP